MAQLLPAIHYRQDTYTVSFDPRNNNNVGIKVAKPKPSNISLDQWEEAFLIYMAIYTERFNVCPAMCTYIRDIRILAQRNANFRFYD